MPVPPGPVSVSNLVVASRRVASATSRALPTKLVIWVGRLFGAGVERAERREGRRQAVDDRLVDAFRLSKILEAMPAEIAQLHARRQSLFDEGASGLGEQDLPAVSDSGDPGGPMDVQADVRSVADEALARMQSHPYMHGRPARPLVTGQGALRRNGRRQSRRSAGERSEERVALRSDGYSTRILDRTPEQAVVLAQDSG